MGAASELAIPQGGAASALPIPETSQVVTPQQADIEGFTSTAGSFRRGVRSGANSIGAMMNNLIGQTSETLGLREFAADRFEEAKNFASMSEAVDPTIKDIGQIKDLNTLSNFVLGHAGKGVTTSLPAVALGLGLRSPTAGVMLGSLPFEAGEQVGSLRADPKVMANSTPGQILTNALGKGAVTSAMETFGAPGQAVRKILNPTKGGLGKGILKATAGEGITEGAQEIVGDVAQQQLNPEHQIDPHQVLNAAAAGAAGGAAIGGGASVAAALPGAIGKTATNVAELRQRLGKKEKPVDPDTDLPPPEVKTEEEILSWLERRDKDITEKMTSTWDAAKSKFKTAQEFAQDPEARAEYVRRAKAAYNETEVAPIINDAIDTIKTYTSAGKKYFEKKQQAKYSKMENRPDFSEIEKDVLVGAPIFAGKNKEIADFLAQNGYKQVESSDKWEPVRKHSEVPTRVDIAILDMVTEKMPKEFRDAASPEQLVEFGGMIRKIVQDPEYFENSGVPHTLQKVLGDTFPDMVRRAVELVYDSKPAQERALRKIERAFDKKKKQDGTRLEAVQDIVLRNIRPEYKIDPRLRNEALNVLAPKLLGFLHGKGNTPKKALQPAMYESFGEKADLVFDELEEYVKSEKTARAYDEEGKQEDIKDLTGIPIRGLDNALEQFDSLREQYGPKQVHLSIKTLDDGRYSIEAEDADQAGLTSDVIKKLIEDPKRRQAGIRIELDGEAMTINPVKLTSHMMVKEGQQAQQGGAKYVHDMFSRGVSALLSSEGVKPLTDFQFKNEMPVGVLNGKTYTYGMIKAAQYGQSKKAKTLRKAIREAKNPGEREFAVHELSVYYNEGHTARQAAERMEEDALAMVQDEGPEFLEEAIAPMLELKNEIEAEINTRRNLFASADSMEAKTKEKYRERDDWDKRVSAQRDVKARAFSIQPNYRLALQLDNSIARVERTAEKLYKSEQEASVDNPEFVQPPNYAPRNVEEDTGAPVAGSTSGPKGKPEKTAVTTGQKVYPDKKGPAPGKLQEKNKGLAPTFAEPKKKIINAPKNAMDELMKMFDQTDYDQEFADAVNKAIEKPAAPLPPEFKKMLNSKQVGESEFRAWLEKTDFTKTKPEVLPSGPKVDTSEVTPAKLIENVKTAISLRDNYESELEFEKNLRSFAMMFAESNPSEAENAQMKEILNSLRPIETKDDKKLEGPKFSLMENKGKVRIYRGETSIKKEPPEWVRQRLEETGHSDAEGRWWTTDRKIANWYAEEAGENGRVVWQDVDASVVEQSKISNMPDNIKRFSKDPENELFLPKDFKSKFSLMENAKPISPELDKWLRSMIKQSNPWSSSELIGNTRSQIEHEYYQSEGERNAQLKAMLDELKALDPKQLDFRYGLGSTLGNRNWKGPKPGMFSTMNVGKGSVSEEEQQAVRDYVKKVLGDKKTKVLFEKLDHAGEFANLSGVETLKIAIDAIDPMSVGHHEAMHAFFARLVKANPKAAHVLLRAAGSAPVVARLNELLKGHPKAREQLKDPEEALAYMYQFWAKGEKGLLSVGPYTKTWFDKVKQFFRSIAAVWADDMNTAMAVDRAGHIIEAFHNGEFANRNTVAEVLRDKFPEDIMEKTARVWPGLGRLADKFIWTSTGAVRDMNLPPLTKIMDQFHIDMHSPDKTPGFIQAKNIEMNKRLNQVIDVVAPLSEAQRREVLDEMRSGKPRTSAAAKKIESVLAEIHDYMSTAGVKTFDPVSKEWVELGKVKENYFPRVPDLEYLRTAEGKAGFIELLKKHKVKDPEKTYQNYTSGVDAGKPQEDLAIGLTYFTPQASQRSLTSFTDEELSPFLNKDLFGTLSQYISRAARRAEYTSRFGNAGENIAEAEAEANELGMTEAQGRTFVEAVQALDGSIGANTSDELKTLFGALTTYQNIRLLPLALFSSLIDSGGIVVRGGTVKEGFKAFWRGLRELYSSNEDDAYVLAKTIGAISASHDISMLTDMYGGQYMPKLQRTINDKFFKYNGMEGWNKSMRVSATAAAEQFIIRHATKKNEHSDRYLAELGLTDEDVVVYNGRLEINDKVSKALNLWVDQAILRPNAALRPIYMSDPSWMLVSHLKQYTYLFQKTIIARVNHELQHGNYTPAMALASYVPAIIAIDMARIALTPGGGDDQAREGWGPSDWLWRGIQRAGIFGPGQLVLDSGSDVRQGAWGIESMVGPTGEQLIDFVRASLQGSGVGNELIKAIPGSRLVR